MNFRFKINGNIVTGWYDEKYTSPVQVISQLRAAYPDGVISIERGIETNGSGFLSSSVYEQPDEPLTAKPGDLWIVED